MRFYCLFILEEYRNVRSQWICCYLYSQRSEDKIDLKQW